MVKKELKIAGYSVFGLLSLWLAGTFWAVTWVDKQALIDFPGRAELNFARFFWSTSPAIDRTHDADRALKFSWLRASTEINRKEKKEISKIIDVLAEEFSFTAKYFERHGRTLSPDIKSRAAVQLLTYLNRLEMFQSFANPVLESKLMEFGGNVKSASPSTQENWQREMMIRSRLKGDQSAYQDRRDVLLRTLVSHANDIPKSFLEGIFHFYDGVLLCVVKKNQEAAPFLDLAAKKLSGYPRYTTNFLNGDLNVLLLGKGMEAGSDCNESISKVISSGV
ncbi:MAG: hypothetical protein ACK5PF_03410 [bacterium]|jgi:hypothetical protein